MKNPVALLSFVLAASALAQQPPLQPGDPASVGCDPQGLAAAADVVGQLVAEDLVLGAVVMVVRGHTIVLHEAFGARDVDGELPMRKDTLFRMASNTKAVTAAAVLALVDDGKVGLDDPVAKWFPTFARDGQPPITVRHLLTHSSGLRIGTLFVRPLMAKSAEHPDAPSLVLECARFGEVGAEVPPGTTYSYSNPGYNTLAGIVEVASGQPFERFCAQRFYEPLGMRDSNHHETTADNARMSVVVRGKQDGRWRAVWSPNDPPTVPFVRGSGGMISTAADFAKFCRMILDGGQCGERRLLSQAIVAQATRDQIPHIADRHYGFGWRIHEDGSCSHGGSDGTYAWCDPTRDLIGILFTQTQSPPAVDKRLSRFRELVTAAAPVLSAAKDR